MQQHPCKRKIENPCNAPDKLLSALHKQQLKWQHSYRSTTVSMCNPMHETKVNDAWTRSQRGGGWYINSMEKMSRWCFFSDWQWWFSQYCYRSDRDEPIFVEKHHCQTQWNDTHAHKCTQHPRWYKACRTKRGNSWNHHAFPTLGPIYFTTLPYRVGGNNSNTPHHEAWAAHVDNGAKQ